LENNAELGLNLAILRISVKYDASASRQRASRNLESIFPSSLSDWERLPRILTKERACHVFDAIDIARIADIPQILPAVLYECAFLIDAETLLGTATLHNRSVRLSNHDRIVCINAQKNLSTCRRRLILHSVGCGIGFKCRSAAACNAAKLQWLGSVDFGKPLDDIDWDDTDTSGFCADCLAFAKAAIQYGRGCIWEVLSRFRFGESERETLVEGTASAQRDMIEKYPWIKG
jgi:hypothetical protein